MCPHTFLGLVLSQGGPAGGLGAGSGWWDGSAWPQKAFWWFSLRDSGGADPDRRLAMN